MRRFLSYQGPPVEDLTQLGRLRLVLAGINTVSDQQLFEVLHYCSQLTRATLSQCPVTDVLLSRLLAYKSLSKLQRFHLHAIQSVTVTSLRDLVSTPRDLNVVIINRCPSVSRADFESLRTLATNLGLDLDITYYWPWHLRYPKDHGANLFSSGRSRLKWFYMNRVNPGKGSSQKYALVRCFP